MSGQANPDPLHLQRAGTLQLQALPLALYVHWPWCVRKCPYCDFNSHAAPQQGAPMRAYLHALRADLEAALPLVWGRTVHSVFMGGGTPSLAEPELIAEWLSYLRATLRLAPNAEITLEANPGTFETQRFADYVQAGVTRLSIGVQSFNNQALSQLGRVHNAAQAHAALQEAARVAPTFNLDLMYALPGQDLAACRQDVAEALAHAPPHVSIYQLTIEPNTLFAARPPQLPNDDTAYAMLDAITDATQAAGLGRYEVSAYAKPGHTCWHNTNYWTFGDYLGIGAGAHSKLSFAHRVLRQVRLREPALYMQGATRGQAVTKQYEVNRRDLAFEYMLGALRLKDGVSLTTFTERTGLPTSAIRPALEQAQARGLLVQEGDHLRPSAKGFDFLSDLQAMFLPPESATVE